MSENTLERITDQFPSNIEEIKSQILHILDLFEEHLTNHKLQYFYKKNIRSKQEVKIYVFSSSNIMHLIGIKAYKIVGNTNIHTVPKDPNSVTNAIRFYKDYLSNRIEWENVWIDSPDYLILKLEALKYLPNLKQYGVRLSEQFTLTNFYVDSVLQSKNALAIGFYSSRESEEMIYCPRTSINLTKRTLDSATHYIVTKIIDYKKNADDSFSKLNTYNFTQEIQQSNSKKKSKRKRHK